MSRTIASARFTRPADTTAYASGDALVEARGAYTPTSGGVFTVSVETAD